MTAPVGSVDGYVRRFCALFGVSALMSFMHLNFSPSLVIRTSQLEAFSQMDSHLEWQCDCLLLVSHD